MSNINFNQTFPPTLEYLSRLLEITDMSDELTKEEISDITSIPTGKSSGKVEPHIDYAIYMGLIENISISKNKYRLICTPLGRIIKTEDIGIQEEVSQLLCHARITSPTTGAVLWSVIIRNILPNYQNGIRLILLEDELKKIPCFTNGKIKSGPFFSTYEKSFEAFKLISKNKDTLSVISQVYKNELFYVYVYTLLYEWEQVYPDNNEISSVEFEGLKFAGTFGFSGAIVNQVLERISEKSLIKINGQLSPFTIIKIAKSDDILSLIYSLLC